MRLYSSTYNSKNRTKLLFPSRGQLAFLSTWLCFAHFAAGYSWWEIFKFVVPLFVASYSVISAVGYALDRWPEFFESRRFVVGVRLLLSITIGGLLGYWVLFGGIYGPDWKGALFALSFGAIIVVVLWPVYWLFERFIKPWAVRTNRHFAGFFAIASIAILYWGAWLGALFTILSRV